MGKLKNMILIECSRCLTLSILSCLLILEAKPCEAFLSLSVRSPSFIQNSHSCLYGKPPPISQSDLAKIEAIEKEFDDAELFETFDGAEDEWEFTESDSGLKQYEVPNELKNKRIDAIISTLEPDMSRSQCGSLITNGMVAIQMGNEKKSVVTRKSEKLPQGTIIYVQHIVDETPTEILPEDLPLEILYEDEYMIVLNKAAGMVVHPAVGNWNGTVVNALAYYLANKSPFGSGDFIESSGKIKSDQGEGIDVDGTDGEAVTFRPGIVHRLDKGTTGILVVSKTRAVLAALSEAFAARRVKKTYVAVTIGNPGKRVTINKPIGRHPIHRQKMRVVPDPNKMNSSRMRPKERMAMEEGKSLSQTGRNALSYIDTLAFDGRLSVVQVRIETGRTHQIRVHLQDRTTPVYGDEVYGFGDWNKKLLKSQKIERPLLHAFRLELNHPVTGKNMVIRAPMAKDMMTVAKGIWPEGALERKELFETTPIEITE